MQRVNWKLLNSPSTDNQQVTLTHVGLVVNVGRWNGFRDCQLANTSLALSTEKEKGKVVSSSFIVKLNTLSHRKTNIQLDSFQASKTSLALIRLYLYITDSRNTLSICKRKEYFTSECRVLKPTFFSWIVALTFHTYEEINSNTIHLINFFWYGWQSQWKECMSLQPPVPPLLW